MEKDYKKNPTDKSPHDYVMSKQTEKYMNKMTDVFYWTTIIISICSVVSCLLVMNGFSTYFLQMQNSDTGSTKSFYIEALIHTSELWLTYFVFNCIYKRSNFKTKKLIFNIAILVYISFICFSHWKYSYLSILYCLPVGVTSLIGKKYHITTLIISIFIAISYSILQYLFFGTEYNFLIISVSVLTMFITYMISKKVHGCLVDAVTEVEKYCSLSNDLYDKLSHDSLTGSFTKGAMYMDYNNDNDFKSIAFIDLDNFKQINDKEGHNVGDYILTTLVRSFLISGENIYRYGGDEFVVLSEKCVDDLYKEMVELQDSFNTTCLVDYMVNISFSAGIVPVCKTCDLDTLLARCDKVMYHSKANGKNMISK